LVIDSISIILYIDRELYLTACLFAGYVILVIYGYMQWRKIYLQTERENKKKAAI